MAKIKGLQAALTQLRRLRKQTDDIISSVLAEEGQTVLQEAKAAAPMRDGVLKNSGGVLVEGRTLIVFFAARHAPFVEFGTGPFVQVPRGYEEYAMTFFVNGKGNSKPRPFLFPAGFRAQARIMQKLEERFNQLN